MPQDFLNFAKGLAAPSEFSYSKKCLFSDLNIIPSARAEFSNLLVEFFFLFPPLVTIYLMLAIR
jgi:hypothetical protein